MADAVDEMMAQWRRIRPDLDPSPMGVFGRVARLNRLLDRELKQYFERHGLEFWEFDVLATLRRAGDDDTMTAGALLKASMVTSGAITNRLDRLERKGLVVRLPDPADRRSVRVALTPRGHDLVEEIVGGHFDNERRVLSVVDGFEELAEQLRTLLTALGDTSLR